MPFKLLTNLTGNRETVSIVEPVNSELNTSLPSCVDQVLCTKTLSTTLMNKNDSSASQSEQLDSDVAELPTPSNNVDITAALPVSEGSCEKVGDNPSPNNDTPVSSCCDPVTIKTNPERPRLRIMRYQDPNRTSMPHLFDTVEAELDDLLVVKLGRPVKSKEEKERERQQQGESDDGNNQEGDNDAAASAKAEASAQPSGSMTVAQGKNGRTIQYVWFKSKVVSRTHAEIWLKDGQLYIKDNASSSGTFLNRLRLSSSGKESRPYPLKDGDVIQLGIDYQGRPEDIYKSVLMKVTLLNKRAIDKSSNRANPYRFQNALRALLASTNPYANSNNSTMSLNGASSDNQRHTVDCCICLSPLNPFQAMFISPCSHCYHYKCIHTLLDKGVMFQCPLCRQVANLNASVSVDSLDETPHDEFIQTPSFNPALAQISQGVTASPLPVGASPSATISAMSPNGTTGAFTPTTGTANGAVIHASVDVQQLNLECTSVDSMEL